MPECFRLITLKMILLSQNTKVVKIFGHSPCSGEMAPKKVFSDIRTLSSFCIHCSFYFLPKNLKSFQRNLFYREITFILKSLRITKLNVQN